MRSTPSVLHSIRLVVRGALATLLLATAARAQSPASSTSPSTAAWTTRDDYANMLQQLGIRVMRPGPSGNDSAANHANYDEALANPFTHLPDVLLMRNRTKVTSATQWPQRRAEIVEDFEREVYGRVPRTVPNVSWSVAAQDTGTIMGRRVIGRQVIGHVDNSAYPALKVDISLIVVLPANAQSVPVMMLFGERALPQALGRPASPSGSNARGVTAAPAPAGSDAPATEQLIADGWGVAFVNPLSIQADDGAGITKGVIGLANRGQPRKPDDWGALRAWAWGASRALDYLGTEKGVDRTRVGIEGMSRYGKAALVTMAFDERFALGAIGSSGIGGARLFRRNFGEAVESVTGPAEYHWMAGNFLKYGTAESAFGARNANDLPVDSHELLALCAPRPLFLSSGVPEQGDAKWLDPQGSFMAAIAAQPVYRLLGAKDMGRPDDYMTEKMPTANVGLLDGQLAWRQHDGGLTDGPNWRYFLQWADRNMNRVYTPAPGGGAANGIPEAPDAR